MTAPDQYVVVLQQSRHGNPPKNTFIEVGEPCGTLKEAKALAKHDNRGNDTLHWSPRQGHQWEAWYFTQDNKGSLTISYTIERVFPEEPPTLEAA